MGQLQLERKRLRNRVRRETDPEALAAHKQEITALTDKIGKLREKLFLCDGIAERSKVMEEKLSSIRQTEGKEEKDHEHRRRSSRADR